jgi:CAAX protease family protein
MSRLSRTERRAVIAYLGITYSLSWAWAFALVSAGTVVRRGDGWPTHAPALIAPGLAAVLVCLLLGDRRRLAGLAAGLVRWRMPLRWWVAALSPLGFLAVALAAGAAAGQLPAAGAFGRYTGLPAVGVLGVAALALVVNGFGEETGWRGFLLPLLQKRVGALEAALVIAPLWALWHLPFFFLLASYRGFGPLELVGFLIGITSGSIVLTWLYNGSGGSILAVAVWHTLYNLTTATTAGEGIVAPVVSTLVIVLAVVLVRHELRARRQGRRPLLGPPPPRAAGRRSPIRGGARAHP